MAIFEQQGVHAISLGIGTQPQDPDAEHAARARAAIALSGALAAPDRERLRVAADATVSPQLRVALDAAAGDNDALLAEQLDELPEAGEGKHAEARTDR